MAEGLSNHKEDFRLNSSLRCHSNKCSGNLGILYEKAKDSKTKMSNMSNGSLEEKICRDFLRKVCHRGNRCKFLHPEKEDISTVTQQPSTKKELTFCHDFQNGLCPRTTCRFIHCTVGEEDYYLSSDHVLPHILEQAIVKGQILDSDAAPNGDAPICKDFLMGDCHRKRGGKCKFRHLTKMEYEQEIYGSRRGLETESQPHYECLPPIENGIHPPNAKRQRFEFGQLPTDYLREREQDFFRPYEDIGRGELLPRDVTIREYRERDRELDREIDRRGLEEILLLRKQLETMKKEVVVLKKENSDLRATNDFLLEKLTSIGRGNGGGTVTTVTVPTVSLASSIPIATSVRPLTSAQVSHPLSITSECSMGSVMTIAPPQVQASSQSLASQNQQVGVAQAPTAVLGPVGSVQVSLSQAPTLTAVTLSTVSLTTMAPATSMAPSMAPPPPGSVQSIAQAMSISGASGHLVTYPIMTQPGLRPQMQ